VQAPPGDSLQPEATGAGDGPLQCRAFFARLSALGRRELSEGGPAGRLYLEGLAAMLTVHLLRSYGSPECQPLPHRGGLAPRPTKNMLRQVVEEVGKATT
jgi:hypothetical protein